ncbi:hypothetical protein DFS34DRAFT_621397 [Phlyctochytrium arcticum]|nr:hypothetical protein DFS34DRAFT_621397 [Phlyctochytrium arcticum]
MVAISIHPIGTATSLVSGYNNVGSWCIEGVVRLVAGNQPDEVPDSAVEGKHKPAYTATSIRIALNVSVGAAVATRSESNIMAALGSSGSHDNKFNGVVHMNKELELIPQTNSAANSVVVKKGETVDLPFCFEFGTALAPTCEVERGRYTGFSRYRLNVNVAGRPHGIKLMTEPKNHYLEYDVPAMFFDAKQVKKLLHPEPQTWSGTTEELDWSISLSGDTFGPGEFVSVYLKANLRERTDAGANPIAAPPSTEAAAVRSAGVSDKRLHPAPYIQRARLSVLEDATIQAYQVYQNPVAAKLSRGGFSLRRKSNAVRDAPLMIDRDVGSGQVEIMMVDIDGENLEHGHELKVQLPAMAPSLQTPGSQRAGKALIDRKMSTGDTRADATSAVQINPTGSWGTFSIAHSLRIIIEVADGHTVLWETPITVAPATAQSAQALLEVYPQVLELADLPSNATSPTASMANLEEQGKELLLKAAQAVNAVVRPDVPCVRVDSTSMAVAAAQ